MCVCQHFRRSSNLKFPAAMECAISRFHPIEGLVTRLRASDSQVRFELFYRQTDDRPRPQIPAIDVLSSATDSVNVPQRQGKDIPAMNQVDTRQGGDIPGLLRGATLAPIYRVPPDYFLNSQSPPISPIASHLANRHPSHSSRSPRCGEALRWPPRIHGRNFASA